MRAIANTDANGEYQTRSWTPSKGMSIECRDNNYQTQFVAESHHFRTKRHRALKCYQKQPSKITMTTKTNKNSDGSERPGLDLQFGASCSAEGDILRARSARPAAESSRSIEGRSVRRFLVWRPRCQALISNNSHLSLWAGLPSWAEQELRPETRRSRSAACADDQANLEIF